MVTHVVWAALVAFGAAAFLAPPAAGQVARSSLLQPTCTANATYAGPSRRELPAEVWQRDFSRDIDGSLPAFLSSAVQSVVDDLIRRIPAVSVAIAIPGVGRWDAIQGVSRVDPKVALPRHPRFQVASTTKTLTAVTVLQLAAEGKLELTQPIAPWFGDVTNGAIITLDQLLRHTSGLVSFNALPSWTTEYRTPRDAIAMGTAAAAHFCPGTSFSYSNTGYSMLGVIVEQLEGRRLGEVFADRLTTPLGMAHTSLRYPNENPSVVTGYLGGQLVDLSDGYATPFAAGALMSTAADLVTFWHALLSGRLIPQATVRAMFTDLVPMDEKRQMFYGRGVQLYDFPGGPGMILGHSGGISGFSSVVGYLVTDDMYVSVVSSDQRVAAEPALWSIVRAVRAARALQHRSRRVRSSRRWAGRASS